MAERLMRSPQERLPSTRSTGSNPVPDAPSLITGNVVNRELINDESEVVNDGSIINELKVIRANGFVKQEVLFDAYDLDSDGKIDYIEWVVPHLSNQTFEIIIEITKAEHLDSNRNFISDIYEEVKALDGNWSEAIPAGDYVRVTFEKNLTSDKDITVYARASCANNSSVLINGENVPCEIYKKKLRINEIRRELR